MDKKQIFIILVITLLFSCGKNNIKEKEPNDNYRNANNYVIGKSIEGYMNTDNDVDYYMLRIDQPQMLNFNLSAVKGVNLAINIYKSNNDEVKLIKVIDDLRKSAPERFKGLFADVGTYYVSILHGDKDLKKSNNEVPYILTIQSESYLGYEKEPNDNKMMATPIESDVAIKGYFSPAMNKLNINPDSLYREEDWYSFYFQKEEDIKLCNIELSAVPGIVSAIELYDSEGELLAQNKAKNNGEMVTIKNVGLTKSGYYYICVYSNDLSYNNDVLYELLYYLSDYNQLMELEPNNDFDSSNEIKSMAIQGYINKENDIDYYKLNTEYISKDKFYLIQINNIPDLDIVLELYNSDKDLLYKINNGSVGENEIIPDLYVNDDLYIKIYSKNRQYNNLNYYSINLSPVDIDNCYDYEPNDNKANAVLVNSDVINGFITFKKDVDYYLIKYDNRNKNIFTVNAPDNVDIEFSITDSLGYKLQSVVVKAGSSKKLMEIIDYKGYLIVKAANNDYNGLYSIVIEDSL